MQEPLPIGSFLPIMMKMNARRPTAPEFRLVVGLHNDIQLPNLAAILAALALIETTALY